MNLFDKDGNPSENNYPVMFFGDQFAIGLRIRGPADPHILFDIFSEDDDNWFAGASGASSSWTSDLINVLNWAEQYMQKNCEPDIVNEIQYGYRFRTATDVRIVIDASGG